MVSVVGQPQVGTGLEPHSGRDGIEMSTQVAVGGCIDEHLGGGCAQGVETPKQIEGSEHRCHSLGVVDGAVF